MGITLKKMWPYGIVPWQHVNSLIIESRQYSHLSVISYISALTSVSWWWQLSRRIIKLWQGLRSKCVWNNNKVCYNNLLYYIIIQSTLPLDRSVFFPLYFGGNYVVLINCLSLDSYYFIFRVVGGPLSAYDSSADKMFLEKARDITDPLLPEWDTSSGIPYNRINLAQGQANNPGWNCVRLYFSIFQLVR